MSAWNFKDLTGQKFGRLTVIERAENKGKHVYWCCKCECGNICIVNASNLTRGATKSCGCSIGQHHGMRHTKIYRIWCGIKNRCFNKNTWNYSRYGGRGITMYPAWVDDFLAFYNYVSTLENFGEKGYSLDRIDNNGNYEPGNLRFVDAKTQARNTRRNVYIEYEGKKVNLKEAAEKSGINYGTLWNRYKRGDTSDKLFRPVKNSSRQS